jgi:hypothetical protein
MGGHVKPRGAACLPDLNRWYHEAATFLSHTTSATSVHELQGVSLLKARNTETNFDQHEFLKLSGMPEQLKSVVSRVIRTARIQLEDIPPSV